MGVSVLDDMPTDQRPVKGCASRNIGGWVFDNIEDTANTDASTRARTNPELGDADQLADDNDGVSFDINCWDEVDRIAVSNEGRANIYDLCDVAHNFSSLAQTNANK